jgi:hypothetical protein
MAGSPSAYGFCTEARRSSNIKKGRAAGDSAFFKYGYLKFICLPISLRLCLALLSLKVDTQVTAEIRIRLFALEVFMIGIYHYYKR